jgi:DNA helicase HerA-like ATPase
MADLIDRLDKNAKRAMEVAEKFGEIVGWVSRTSPSLISEEGGEVVFDVEPEIYFSFPLELASSGSYLAVVDIKTQNIISLRVVSVERRDVLAELNIPELSMSPPGRDIYGLLTRARIRAKPLLSYDPFNDVVSAANYVVEPQSPVIRPKDEKVIQRLLGLPSSGVFIGYPTVGDKPIFDLRAPLFLPLKAFYQHVLVLGTTGSGKTTMLKNLISAMSSGYRINNDKPSIIIMDPNRDYVTLPLKPLYSYMEGLDVELEKKMIENSSKNISPPKGIVLLIPITSNVLERLDIRDTKWAKAIMMIANDYFSSTYSALAEKLGWKINILELT